MSGLKIMKRRKGKKGGRKGGVIREREREDLGKSSPGLLRALGLINRRTNSQPTDSPSSPISNLLFLHTREKTGNGQHLHLCIFPPLEKKNYLISFRSFSLFFFLTQKKEKRESPKKVHKDLPMATTRIGGGVA